MDSTASDSSIHTAISAHLNTPIKLLRKLPNLVTKPKYSFWSALVSNPHTPLDMLEMILATQDPKLYMSIVDHPAWAHDRNRIIFRHFIQRLKGEINGQASRFRLLLATYPAAPVEVLELFASSDRWEERYLVARHPSTPAAIVKSLRDDSSFCVRDAARKRNT